jgi:hypothetical protein
MPVMDVQAQALSEARARILKLQEQMTDRVLRMAAEVQNLMEIVPPRRATVDKPDAEADASLLRAKAGGRNVVITDWTTGDAERPAV